MGQSFPSADGGLRESIYQETSRVRQIWECLWIDSCNTWHAVRLLLCELDLSTVGLATSTPAAGRRSHKQGWLGCRYLQAEGGTVLRWSAHGYKLDVDDLPRLLCVGLPDVTVLAVDD